MKTIQLIMIKTIRLFILLCSVVAFGQDSTVEGEINAVKENGLHRIRVPHNLRSYAATDLRDLRIWDAKDGQVPYYMESVGSYSKIKVSNFWNRD